MTRQAKAVRQKALGLAPVERAELIQALLRSFDRGADASIDAAWAKEGESRLDAYHAGKLKAVPLETVMRRIGKR
jgi:putative addiction module component (TIGR02574 family)